MFNRAIEQIFSKKDQNISALILVHSLYLFNFHHFMDCASILNLNTFVPA